MCYVIECKVPFNPKHFVFGSVYSMWLTVEKKSEIKEVDLRMTSQYDYLSIAHIPRFDYRPFWIKVPFGTVSKRIKRVLAIENEVRNLNCETSNLEYSSFEQCLVDLFVSSNFSYCPTKCIPVQMKGFKYINESLTGKLF